MSVSCYLNLSHLSNVHFQCSNTHKKVKCNYVREFFKSITNLGPKYDKHLPRIMKISIISYAYRWVSFGRFTIVIQFGTKLISLSINFQVKHSTASDHDHWKWTVDENFIMIRCSNILYLKICLKSN